MIKNTKTYPKLVIWLVPCLLFPFFALSCSKKPVEKKEELVIGISQDYRATDVFSHKGFNCLIFETLIKLDENGHFSPLLAESWEKSDDGKHYTFHLNKGITFSDGAPLTAERVKEAMFFKQNRKRKRGPGRFGGKKADKGRPEKLSKSEDRPSYAKESQKDINREYGTFDNRRYNLPQWSCFSSIDVLDAHTLRFNLPEPYTLFLDELSCTHGHPVLKIDESETVTGYIGTGPYKIETLKRTQYMTLIKNEHYWQGDVGIKRIRLKVIPDPETRAMALEAGEIDLTGYDHFDKIPNESVLHFKTLPDITLKTMGNAWQPSVSYITINPRKDFLQDPNIRKALIMAMNPKPIQALIEETTRILDGPFPDAHPLSRPGLKQPAFDREKSIKILNAAGWMDSDDDGILDKDGRSLTLSLTFSSFDPQYKAIAEMVQAQYLEMGINLSLRMVELGAHITAMRNGEYDLAFWPMMRYHMFFYTGHPSWLNVYNSSELDNAFYSYLHNNDKEMQKAAVYKTQEEIVASHAFSLFFERFDVVAWNHEVLKDFHPLPIGWDLSKGIWKARVQ